MKGQQTYILTSNQKSEIDKILDNGLEKMQIDNSYRFNRSGDKDFKNSYTPSNQYIYNQSYDTLPNSYSNKIVNPNNEMRDDLKALQRNIDVLEKKLFTINNSNEINRGSYNRNISRSVDLKEKVAMKENIILQLKNEISELQRDNDKLKENIELKDKEIAQFKEKLNLKEKEAEDLKQYEIRYGKLSSDYRKLLCELNQSEEMRSEQKNKIKKMQDDIDAIRQKSIDKINFMEHMVNINNSKKEIVDDINKEQSPPKKDDKKKKKTIKKK